VAATTATRSASDKRQSRCKPVTRTSKTKNYGDTTMTLRARRIAMAVSLAGLAATMLCFVCMPSPFSYAGLMVAVGSVGYLIVAEV